MLALDILLTAWLHDSLSLVNMIGMIDAAIWAYGMLVSVSEGVLTAMFYAIAKAMERRQKEREMQMKKMERATELARSNPNESVVDIVNRVLAESQR